MKLLHSPQKKRTKLSFPAPNPFPPDHGARASAGDKPTGSPSQRELRPTTMVRESRGEKGGPPHLSGLPGAKATPKPKGKRASDPSSSC